MNKLLFFLFLLVSVSVFSQADSLVVKNDKSSIVQKKFDANNLDNYKKDKDFIYEEDLVKAEPSFFERVFNWFVRQLSRFLEWVFGVKYAKGILAGILSALPYIVAGVVLFLLIKFFLKVKTNAIVVKSKNKATISINEEEELIKNKDISKLIHQAIHNKNYRLAVRYYYLNILKQLENKEIIIWEQQKTNEDYIHEIQQQNIKNSFINLTRLYDFVWYGNFQITENEFGSVESDFVETNNLINKK